MTFYVMTGPQDPWYPALADDPIRLEIPGARRLGPGADVVLLLTPDGQPGAILCLAYTATLPAAVEDLWAPTDAERPYAVGYTIWSYQRGYGRALLQRLPAWLRTTRPTVTRLVTLSPCTDVVQHFHLGNGATIARQNETSINYEYPLDPTGNPNADVTGIRETRCRDGMSR